MLEVVFAPRSVSPLYIQHSAPNRLLVNLTLLREFIASSSHIHFVSFALIPQMVCVTFQCNSPILGRNDLIIGITLVWGDLLPV